MASLNTVSTFSSVSPQVRLWYIPFFMMTYTQNTHTCTYWGMGSHVNKIDGTEIIAKEHKVVRIQKLGNNVGHTHHTITHTFVQPNLLILGRRLFVKFFGYFSTSHFIFQSMQNQKGCIECIDGCRDSFGRILYRVMCNV